MCGVPDRAGSDRWYTNEQERLRLSIGEVRTTMSSAENDTGAGTATWARWESLPAVSPWPGITLRLLSGKRVMMSWVSLEPNAVVPPHAHPHEQTGVSLDGVLDLTIGGETRRLTAGDAYIIPSGVEHSAVAGPEGSLVLDIFGPPREDYLALLNPARAATAGEE